MTPTSAEIKKLLMEKAPPSTAGESVRDSIIVVLAEQVESLETSLSKVAKGLRAVAIVVGHMQGGDGAEEAAAAGPAGQGQAAAGAPSDEAPGGGAPRDQTPFPTNLTPGGAQQQQGQKVVVQAPPDEGGGAPKPNVSSGQATNAQPIPKKQGAPAPQPNGKE